MRLGIFGWNLSGKTCCFDALTGAHEKPGDFSAKTHIGVAKVPDERVDFLADVFKPKKIAHASVEYVDLPGLANDAHAHDVNPKTLSDVRQADALIAVVRAFEEPTVPAPFGEVDPVRDFSRLYDELLFADLEMADRRIARLEVDIAKPTDHQKDDRFQLEVLRRVKTALEEGKGISSLELPEMEAKSIRGFRFLTGKPLMVLLNRGEESVGGPSGLGEKDFGRPVVEMFAKLELELSQLGEADRAAFMEDLGLKALAAPELIREGYEILDQISFLTGAEKEVHAWTIPRGTRAVEAAGVIHSDMERGFIRAEVTAFEDFKELGSFKEARAKGKLRLEGREYVVQDGDIIEFRFSV